ncbi:hypothetical protein OF122_13180 [Pelagibacterium flavum]|uniref:Uncharacterized protein n=1 Tax=Pelagibacterium flavum TaxID=2984530 RepID=A0ABY6IK92_9HYPH|nr:hypothetical protein [Pelagibacterium sp. YIM 151497]UYQ71012.1 hypothetical protein OF122_13180 [Pelagibacterium sp. YIM 151497]
MTRAQLDAQSEYLTTTLQRVRSIGLDSGKYSTIMHEVLDGAGFKAAPQHVKDEILAALEARRFSIAKLGSI